MPRHKFSVAYLICHSHINMNYDVLIDDFRGQSFRAIAPWVNTDSCFAILLKSKSLVTSKVFNLQVFMSADLSVS